jgi:hypothetical protein
VPYWEELIIRDKKSTAFSQHLYGLAYKGRPSIQPAGLLSLGKGKNGKTVLTLFSLDIDANDRSFVADYTLRLTHGGYSLKATGNERWLHVEDVDTLRSDFPPSAPLCYEKGLTGFARLNPTTPWCMAHSCFALRVFDQEGKYVWEDQHYLHGDLAHPVSADVDGDGIDEIVVLQDDHGRADLFVFQRMRRDAVAECRTTLRNVLSNAKGRKFEAVHKSVFTITANGVRLPGNKLGNEALARYTTGTESQKNALFKEQFPQYSILAENADEIRLGPIIEIGALEVNQKVVGELIVLEVAFAEDLVQKLTTEAWERRITQTRFLRIDGTCYWEPFLWHVPKEEEEEEEPLGSNI